MFPNLAHPGYGYASPFKSHAPAPVPPIKGEMWVLEFVMASVRKSETQSRIAAINNARDAILERAEKDHARMMSGLLAKPELTFALKSFGKVVAILIEKGHKDELVKLSKDRRVGKEQQSEIRVALANAGFAALCNPSGEDNLDQVIGSDYISPRRAAAEAEFARLCSPEVSNHC
jgi:hypothetical protein